MKALLPTLTSLLLAAAPLTAAEPEYPLTPDSKPQEGVPKGELIKFEFAESKIFPGTTREVTIYVPRQYDATKPACVYINQDGVQWNAPVVFDNLIAGGEMPVTIGVFVRPGVVKALDGKTALDRFNRSFEYDGLGDGYARFIIEEILPAVEQRTTSNGHKIVLSKSGNDRAIGGSSSGAIAAFTAAWERPDAFSRVFSVVGTYVGLRGGDRYHTLVRKQEPKALRIFLQEGSNDLNIYAGDWWMANQTLQRALAFAGYEHTHVWGEGGHNGKHGTALFPDAMRYLWKDWPSLVKAGTSQNRMLTEILLPGEDWQLVWEGGKYTEGAASNPQGLVSFTDVPNSKSYRVGADGKVTEFIGDTKRGNGQAFGPDGRLYGVAAAEEKIMVYDEQGRGTVIAEGFKGNDLVVLPSGRIYVTNPPADSSQPSNVWLILPDGTKRIADTGLKGANGITVSPDQSLLYVADARSRWIYSYQIQPDGSLAHKQPYFWLHEPDTADDAGADGIDVDASGRVYVASRMGIQICDQPGRVNCILPTPNGKVSNLVFGGPQFDTLYATCGGKVFKRKLNTKGAPSFAAPVKPPTPRL